MSEDERDKKVLETLKLLLNNTINDTIYAGVDGLNGLVDCLRLYGVPEKDIEELGSEAFV